MLPVRQIPRRPLTGIALSFAGGMVLASCGFLPIACVIPLLGLVLAAAFLLLRHRVSTPLVFLSVALVAALRYLTAGSDYAAGSIPQRMENMPIFKVSVIGRVCGPPRYYPYRSGNGGMWLFPLRVEGMREADTWLRRRGRIDVRVLGSAMDEPVALEGQRIRVKGLLQKNEYRNGSSARFKVSSPGDCVGLSAPGFSLFRACRAWRDSAALRLEKGMAEYPVQHAVLRSLVLGFRNEIPEATYAGFRRTGSLHIFAISGLHVGIVALLMIIVLKSMGIPRDRFGIWLVPLLLAYVVATGMKASAVRAMVMAAVFLLGPLFRRKPDVPTSVAFAALLILLAAPHQISSAGFIFSFVVVAFIVMVYAHVPQQMLAGGWLKSYGISLVITSVAAGLASIPLTAYYFNRFSPIALIGNLAVVPLTFCIVLSGWLSILVPAASIVFNHASLAFINTMLWAVGVLDGLPGSSFPVDSPPAAAVVLWYASLVYLLVHASRWRQRACGLAGVGCSILWTLLL